MALAFPKNPTLGQTYFSGSSAVFRYDGEKWGIFYPAIGFDYIATTASLAAYTSQSINQTASFALQAEYGLIADKLYFPSAASASVARFAEHTPGGLGDPMLLEANKNVDITVPRTGSVQIQGLFTISYSSSNADFSISTGEVTIQHSGIYQVVGSANTPNRSFDYNPSFELKIAQGTGSLEQRTVIAKSSVQSPYDTLMCSTTRHFVVGDVLSLQAYNSVNATYSWSSPGISFQVHQLTKD